MGAKGKNAGVLGESSAHYNRIDTECTPLDTIYIGARVGFYSGDQFSPLEGFRAVQLAAEAPTCSAVLFSSFSRRHDRV